MHPDIEALAARLGLPPHIARLVDDLVAPHVLAPTEPTADTEGPDANETYVGDLIESGVTEDASESTLFSALVADRYEDLGRISAGGMGEVRRVRDTELNRTLAMKLIRPALLGRPAAVARFVDEARATAQLQHPGIVPIHDLGTLPDGRVWFTMKEVRGRTFTSVIADVHDASPDRWTPAASGWTFKRLVATFLQTCHAVAYAHERGVVHRDLKPDNIMVGRHGEAWVLDWGLAKVVGRDERDDEELSTGELGLRGEVAGDDTVVTERSGSQHTLAGTIAGTPAYMAPEQARGEVDRIDARSDVYALGATLYHLLSARRPYGTADGLTVLELARSGPPEPVGPTRPGAPPLPPELVAACERAMARDPADRFPSAMALADEIEAWLDGARKTEQGLALTRAALDRVDEARAMLDRADRFEEEGDHRLSAVEPWREDGDKAEAWELQDEAARLRREAALLELRIDQDLHGALRIRDDLPEAHAALAERYRARHAEAEERREPEEVARCETLVRLHAEALPGADPERVRLVRYLTGDGALTLHTDPEGATVELFRCEVRRRRLVEVPTGLGGTTPLDALSLPMGSYLAVIRAPGREPVRYPVAIPRLGHWDGVAPGDREPTRIWLPPEGALDGACYVPAGWYEAGGDPDAYSGLGRRRLWVDGLVVQRDPVTNARYIAFLDDLVRQGRTDEALRHAPRERSAREGEEGALIYGFDGRRFRLEPDADGDVWHPEMPVVMVSWHGARAFAAWEAARTDRPWRLPLELEWEKAARGVDGRWFPWGDTVDPSWARMYDSARGREQHDFGPVTVDRYPADKSPYGVRGMGGNTMDWCLDVFETEPAPPVRLSDAGPAGDTLLRVARGGHWFGTDKECRAAGRRRVEATVRSPSVGMRAVYRVGSPEAQPWHSDARP